MRQALSIIAILFLVISCSKDQKPGPLAPPVLQPSPSIDTLRLVVSATNVPADNFSFAEILAITHLPVPVSRSVTFTSDNGLFSNGSSTVTLVTGANDTTRVYLKHKRAEIARVVATVATNYSKEAFVSFVNAYPTQISVVPDSTVLIHSLTAKSKVNVFLLRFPGLPTEGQGVHFYDSTASSPLRSIGSFFNNTLSNASGLATAEYRITDNTYTGLVYIKCYMDTPGGRIYGQNIILVQ